MPWHVHTHPHTRTHSLLSHPGSLVRGESCPFPSDHRHGRILQCSFRKAHRMHPFSRKDETWLLGNSLLLATAPVLSHTLAQTHKRTSALENGRMITLRRRRRCCCCCHARHTFSCFLLVLSRKTATRITSHGSGHYTHTHTRGKPVLFRPWNRKHHAARYVGFCEFFLFLFFVCVTHKNLHLKLSQCSSSTRARTQ